MEFHFHNTKTKLESTYNLVQVKAPYEYLSQIFEGSEKSTYIEELIEKLYKVKNGEIEQFYFGNDTGFSAVAAQADPEDETEGEEGVYIYDSYGNDREKALYVIPINDIIKLMEDFRDFLKKHKR